jgi:hypothetical protein
MPYDPRMLQMAQQGVRMMSPDQRNAFADPRSQQPKQWWEHAIQYGQPANRPVNTPDYQDPNDPERKKPQPSLLEMGLNIGRMTRPQYDQAIKGAPPGAAANPWAWLGGMWGSPGGGKP